MSPDFDYYAHMEAAGRRAAFHEAARGFYIMMSRIKLEHQKIRMVIEHGKVISVETWLPPEAQGHYDACADCVEQLRVRYQQI